jgi:hypothetical protein
MSCSLIVKSDENRRNFYQTFKQQQHERKLHFLPGGRRFRLTPPKISKPPDSLAAGGELWVIQIHENSTCNVLVH